MTEIIVSYSFDELDSPKCKHGIERDRCLDVACLKYSTIPVRGEKSWDSALQPPSGGTFPNQPQWSYPNQPWSQHTSTWLSRFLTRYSQTDPQPSPSQPEPEAETRQMPVIGYRGWRAFKGPGRGINGRYMKGDAQIILQSLSFGEWDRTRVTKARCGAGYDHAAPNFHCSCGLYVLNDLAAAPNWYGGQWPDGVIVGAVVGWGKVIQHGDEGWRAEYARPIAFLDTSLFKDEPILEEAAQQYGVPILDRYGLQLLATEYGERLS